MMKKRNGNFEYFKPQNGGSFAVSESESDNSNDSDSKKMFSLPKRKVVRPRKINTRNTRKCCRVCLGTSLPLLMALLIVGICSSMVYILLGISGMKREVELLKVRLKQVESADHSNLQESAKLQSLFKAQLLKMKNDEDKVALLDRKLKSMFDKIHTLNRTITKLSKSLHRKHSINSLVKDIDQLQKGMADTDVKIERIEDDGGLVKKNIAILMKVVKKVKGQLFNITEEISKIGHASSNSPSSQSSGKNAKDTPKRVSIILQQILDRYEDKLSNKTKSIAKVLRIHEVRLEEADTRITMIENKTLEHHKQLELLKKISVLLTSEVKLYRNVSQGKLHRALKVLLSDLSQRGLNMTGDLLSIKSSVPRDIQGLIDNYIKSVKGQKKIITPTSSMPITSVPNGDAGLPSGTPQNSSMTNTTANFTTTGANHSKTTSLVSSEAIKTSPGLNRTGPLRTNGTKLPEGKSKATTDSTSKKTVLPPLAVNGTLTEESKKVDDEVTDKLDSVENDEAIEKEKVSNSKSLDELKERAGPSDEGNDKGENMEERGAPPIRRSKHQGIHKRKMHRKRESEGHETSIGEGEDRGKREQYEDLVQDRSDMDKSESDQGMESAGNTEQSDLYDNANNPLEQQQIEPMGQDEGIGHADMDNYETAESDLDNLDNSEAI